MRDPISGEYLNLRLCDMRGLEDSLGVKTQDIAWVLDGHIPEHYQVTNLIYQIFIIMFI